MRQEKKLRKTTQQMWSLIFFYSDSKAVERLGTLEGPVMKWQISTEGPRLTWILGLEKTALRKIRVSGTVLKTQLTRNPPTCMYIS